MFKAEKAPIGQSQSVRLKRCELYIFKAKKLRGGQEKNKDIDQTHFCKSIRHVFQNTRCGHVIKQLDGLLWAGQLLFTHPQWVFCSTTIRSGSSVVLLYVVGLLQCYVLRQWVFPLCLHTSCTGAHVQVEMPDPPTDNGLCTGQGNTLGGIRTLKNLPAFSWSAHKLHTSSGVCGDIAAAFWQSRQDLQILRGTSCHLPRAELLVSPSPFPRWRQKRGINQK